MDGNLKVPTRGLVGRQGAGVRTGLAAVLVKVLAKIFDLCRFDVSTKRVCHEKGIVLLKTTSVIDGMSLDLRKD
jgi:hypothetical protein